MPPDAAEQWLRDNDPDYFESRKGWKDLNDAGEYECPPQEIPWGLGPALEQLIHYGDGHPEYVEPVPDKSCDLCGGLFTPREAKHLYCTNSCKQKAAYRRRHTAS